MRKKSNSREQRCLRLKRGKLFVLFFVLDCVLLFSANSLGFSAPPWQATRTKL